MKPAKLKVFPISEADDVCGVWPVFRELIRTVHTDLAQARFVLAWLINKKPDKNGVVLYGKAQKVPEIWARIAEVDFVIYLNRQEWLRFDEHDDPARMRAYLLDHELCHCAPDIDHDSGDQKIDETGRLLWRMVKHDLQEFRGPVHRHGLCMADVQAFAQVCATAQRELWPVGKEAADDDLVMRIDEALDDEPGWPEGADLKCTISSGGRSVETTVDELSRFAKENRGNPGVN